MELSKLYDSLTFNREEVRVNNWLYAKGEIKYEEYSEKSSELEKERKELITKIKKKQVSRK